MTEPSKWALNAAVAALGEPIRPYQAEAVAIVLDAARRKALEEAAKIALRVYDDDDICDAIRALIDREPTP